MALIDTTTGYFTRSSVAMNKATPPIAHPKRQSPDKEEDGSAAHTGHGQTSQSSAPKRPRTNEAAALDIATPTPSRDAKGGPSQSSPPSGPQEVMADYEDRNAADHEDVVADHGEEVAADHDGSGAARQDNDAAVVEDCQESDAAGYEDIVANHGEEVAAGHDGSGAARQDNDAVVVEDRQESDTTGHEDMVADHGEEVAAGHDGSSVARQDNDAAAVEDRQEKDVSGHKNRDASNDRASGGSVDKQNAASYKALEQDEGALHRLITAMSFFEGPRDRPVATDLRAALESLEKGGLPEPPEMLRALNALVDVISKMEDNHRILNDAKRRYMDRASQPEHTITLETDLVDAAISRLCSHFHNFYEVSFQNSPEWRQQIYKVFEKLTPKYVELFHWKTSRLLYAAFVWDFLIANVFETSSSIWAGPLGKDFEDICHHVQGMLY